MPIFQLFTNISQDKITDDVMTEFSMEIAKMLGKPKHYVYVHILPDQKLAIGSSKDASGFAVLKSIGGIGGDFNKELAKELFPLVNKLLGIPGESLFIEFVALGAGDISHDGKTFEEISASMK